MKIHQPEVAEALASLRSGPAGLDSGEAARRLGTFGPNRVERIAGPPGWRRLLGSFTHFFALILWVASLLGVILVNGLFSFWRQRRAERAILALERLLPRQVKALRDGQLAVLPVEALVPGDVVLLEGGDDVPADCRVIEAFAGRVDNATATGESVPQSRDAGPSAEDSPLRARNVLLAGTSVVAGQMRALAAREEIHDEEAHAALERSLVLLGLVGLEDPPRPEVPAAVATCRTAGVKVVMIAGDRPSTAAAVARQIGLAPSGRPRVLTGDAVARLSDAELLPALEAHEILFARVAPEQKMRIVRVLESKGEIVALTVVQILAVDLGTDMLPALGLGAEPPRAAVMARPPRRRRERLIDTGLLARTYLFLGPIEAVAAMAGFVFVLYAGGWTDGRMLARGDPLYPEATTACLSAIVVVQVVNVLLCRDARLSVFRMPLLENRLILAGIGFEVALALLIVYTPVGNALFRTAPLDGSVWLFLLPFAAAMLVLEEGRKAVVRWSSRPSIPGQPQASLTA